MRHTVGSPGSRLPGSYATFVASIAICCAIGGLGITPAVAETKIEGQADDLQVHADNAPIKEIFEALSARFNLTYNFAPSTGRILSGLYSGSLKQVVARVLDGNDYVLGVVDDHIRIIVLNASNAEAPSAQSVASNEKQVVAQLPASPTSPRRPLAASQVIPPLTSYLR
jgi:hypothetical protein